MAQRTAPARASRVQTQQARNARRTRTSSSQTRTRNEVGRRLTGYVLRFAVNRVVEQRRHRRNEPGHAGGSHVGSALGHAATNALLEELIQEVIEFIVRHNFFLGDKKKNNEKSDGGSTDGGRGTHDSPPSTQPGDSQGDTDPQLELQPSQQSAYSSTEERRRRRHRRRSEAMLHSLNRLSDELEATYDATVRVLRESDDVAMKADNGEGGHGDEKLAEDDGDQQTLDPRREMDESLRTNLENLRRATTRCMARVESVRRSHHGARRGSRQRRAARSSRLSRTDSAMTARS